MKSDFIEHVKQLADPLMVLGTLGVTFDRIEGDYARTSCPVHGGDNPTAFRVNVVTGSWVCFSHGCQSQNPGLVGLVMVLRACNYREAIKYIANVMNISEEGDYRAEVERAKHEQEIKSFVRRQSKSKSNLCTIDNIEEQIHQWMQNRVDYFFQKGYSKETQDYFEVGFHHDAYGIPRATIPIRDSEGRAVAVDGRRIDCDQEPRYFMQPKGFPKNLVLYHYYKIKDYISYFNGVLFVVEGYKACWSMIQAGIFNVVAAMGAGLSGEQPALLQGNLDLQRVVLAFDGDIAGKNGSRRAKNRLGDFIEVNILDFPDGEDPSTLTSMELINITQHYM